jgi:DNA mismatch endonuclease (patch repair protein)
MKDPPYECPTDPARSDLMRRVRQRGTRAENQVADALRGLGVFYRRNVRSLPGSPDFANKSRKWALFVNGCFWHRHKNCGRASTPKRNRDFWLDKFEANEKRDHRNVQLLKSMGFRVFTFWECESGQSLQLRDRLRRGLGAS